MDSMVEYGGLVSMTHSDVVLLAHSAKMPIPAQLPQDRLTLVATGQAWRGRFLGGLRVCFYDWNKIEYIHLNLRVTEICVY